MMAVWLLQVLFNRNEELFLVFLFIVAFFLGAEILNRRIEKKGKDVEDTPHTPEQLWRFYQCYVLLKSPYRGESGLKFKKI